MNAPDLEAIVLGLDAHKSGEQYAAKCPAHEDTHASLSLGKPNGKIVFRCHAGCTQDEILSALRARGLWPNESSGSKQIMATYDYTNQNGALVFQVVRYRPKDFRQRRPDGKGGWIWNMNGIKRVLFNLPAVAAAVKTGQTIAVVEGEKDVESLRKIGITATTNAGGAGKWRSEYSPCLRGARVVILPDNDVPGRKHADEVAKFLANIAAQIKIAELPGLQPKADASDWLAAGGTREGLLRMFEQADERETIDPSDYSTNAPAATELEVSIGDFYALMPMHKYIFKPTGDLWPGESINGRLPPQIVNGEKVRASAWLDMFAPVEQMTWAPCEPQLILDKLIDRGGWIAHMGCHVFNLYRPPPILEGDPSKAGIWQAHLARIFPNEAKHIEYWFAHHIQNPGDKVNHCLVLRGHQGIGKDTILEPVKQAIGAWNWQDINPSQMQTRFNEWCRAVIVRVNEARDLGEYDRFAFYDHSKVYMAAPPDVLRVDEKNIREYVIPNVVGIIITTNHEADGIYLDADDRRHFVANSEAEKEEFDAEYWTDFWSWYAVGGIGHVAAYLRTLDLSGWNAKAPPPKTEAFWRIVHSNAAPEDAELANLIEALGNPQILTLSQLAESARARQAFAIADFLTALKTRRNVQHRLQQQGYVAVRNQDRKDGLWLVAGRRQMVYAPRKSNYRTVVEALRGLTLGSDVQ